MEAPIIKPYKTKEFDSKQSQYHHADKLPMRAIVLGPSGTGKTILLQNMILDVYEVPSLGSISLALASTWITDGSLSRNT